MKWVRLQLSIETEFILHYDKLLFKTRPSFENPSDADGDNRYEVEVTVTAGDQVISNTYTCLLYTSDAADE